MRKKVFILSLFYVALVIQIQGQSGKSELLDEFITKTLDEVSEIPSLAITVVSKDQVLFEKTYGDADIDKGIKSSLNTSYYIASATKSFVGLLAVLLQEDGVLKLDVPITNYAPIKHFKDKSLFKDVTISDLLSHQLGFRNNVLTFRFSSEGTYSYKELIEILHGKTRSLHNQKRFEYDNLGYNIFDLILREEFGLHWKDELARRVFQPLGMTHSSGYVSDVKKGNWSLALPYTAINAERLPTLATTQKNDNTFQAAGGLVCSIKDVQKWLMANMRSGKLGNKQIFGRNTMAEAQAKIVDLNEQRTIFKDVGYALGWFHAKYEDLDAIYHFGGFDGYFSHISFLPYENIGIAIFSNESHFGDNVSNLIAAFAYDLFLSKVENINAYDEKVAMVKERIDKIQKGYAMDRELRSKRNWNLKYPKSYYVGEYHNEYMGTIGIKLENEELKASLGISNNVCSPSSRDDAMRVEFRDGRGNDLQFVDYAKRPVAIVYDGYVFNRTN